MSTGIGKAKKIYKMMYCLAEYIRGDCRHSRKNTLLGQRRQ